MQEQVEKTFKDKDIKPALRPKVELKKFEDGQDIEISVEVEALPKIEPADFKTLSIERMNATAGETEISQALERLQMGKRKTEVVDEKRATKTGDIIVIDFVGTIDGEEFNGGKGKDYYLDLGSNTFIPGFEDQLTGKEIGSQVDVNVSFPEDYHAKNLAGKKALFKVDIKELRKVVK
ncbi:MAG: trigger factor, partial [Alphaproteobacteria bacterium]|nr:trigger factor [Alphaproteobacteria bacterium]